MRTITNTIDISAPPHEVYVALRTLDGYPAWLHHSIVYLGTRAADGPGAYVDSTTVGRMRGTLTGEDPDRSLSFHRRSRPGASTRPSGTTWPRWTGAPGWCASAS